MKIASWIVKPDDVRAARLDGTCFYCWVPLSGEHKKDCVIRQRTVDVEMTIRFPISVPEHWDVESIEFHRNDSTWCTDNVIPELEHEAERVGCLCMATTFRYLGESSIVVEEVLSG